MGEESRSERLELIPLSPDALSGFSKEDPEVFYRNQEVTMLLIYDGSCF